MSQVKNDLVDGSVSQVKMMWCIGVRHRVKIDVDGSVSLVDRCLDMWGWVVGLMYCIWWLVCCLIMIYAVVWHCYAT